MELHAPKIAGGAHRARLVVAAAQLVEVRDERLPLVVAVLMVGERLLQTPAWSARNAYNIYIYIVYGQVRVTKARLERIYI